MIVIIKVNALVTSYDNVIQGGGGCIVWKHGLGIVMREFGYMLINDGRYDIRNPTVDYR